MACRRPRANPRCLWHRRLPHHVEVERAERTTAPQRHIQDVGDACLYLISPWSNGVTGEIHYVDGGANINGMIAMDKASELGDLLTETAAKKA